MGGQPSQHESLESITKTLALAGYEQAPASEARRTLGLDEWARTIASDRAPSASSVEAARRSIETEQTLARDSSAEVDPTLDAEYSALRTLPSLAIASPDTRAARASTAAPSADLVPLRALGEGGMGVVTLARQRSLAREVALKRVRPEARSPQSARALMLEATMTGSLEHPNIVPVHALGRDEQGDPVLVMKRVEGVAWSALLEDPSHPSLRALVGVDDDASQPLREGDRLAAHLGVLVHVCNALHFAHSRGVIHRDLKPENVMIGSFGEVYLLDWGIALRPAAMTDAQRATSLLAGTPCFMAPELVTGRPAQIGVHTDVYLLGATLHAVLMGEPRHTGATVHEVLLRAYESEPYAYPSGVPSELAELCNAATQREPSKRPESALAFRRAVETYLAHRASIDASSEALATLARFERGLRADPLGRSEDLRAQSAWQTLTEVRLGYAQALRGWAANAQARQGLRRVLTLLIEREIALSNAQAASALLDELEAPDAALRSRVDELRAEAQRLREQDADAKREAFERDATVSSRARTVLFVIFTLVLVLTSLPGIYYELRTGALPDSRGLIGLDLFYLLLLGVPTFFMRRRVLVNRAARTLVFSTLLALVLGLVVDVLSALTHRDGRSAAMYSVMVIGSALVGALVWTMPRAATAGLYFIAASIGTVLFPRGSTLFGVLSTVAAIGTLVWASRSSPSREATTATTAEKPRV